MRYTEWLAKYRPVMNGESLKYYETYGEDLEYLQSIDPHHVWTLGDEAGMYIASGMWWANRVAYLVTEVPWEEEEWDNRSFSLEEEE